MHVFGGGGVGGKNSCRGVVRKIKYLLQTWSQKAAKVGRKRTKETKFCKDLHGVSLIKTPKDTIRPPITAT